VLRAVANVECHSHPIAARANRPAEIRIVRATLAFGGRPVFGTLGAVKLVQIAIVSLWLVVFLGCASSSSESMPDARVAADGGPDLGADAGPDAGSSASCPDGQFAVGVAANGDLTCAAVDDATATAVRSRCSVYAGFRDGCDGCTDAPSKWSRSGPLGCSAGVGAGNACIAATLDAPDSLATLDLDGDVNGDDKLYATLHCLTAPRDPRPAPCAPGWAISGRAGSTWMCTPVSEAAVGYVGGRCAIYLGWRDSCDGCTTAPSKWGHADDATCANGVGADDTCTTTTLDGEPVNLFGLNPDGDVDGNDKLYLGLACAAPDESETVTTTQCPDGQFVVGTNADGSFSCADPAATFAVYVRDRCTLLLGWRDDCDACTQAPTKWGQVGTASCSNGAGADNTCAVTALGDVTLPLFGLSTDGNVNSDDTLYVGFRCAQ